MSDGHTTARSPSPAGPDVPPPSRRRRRSQLNVLLHEIEQLPGAKADRCVDKPMVERVFAASSAAAAAPPPDDPATPEHLLSPPTAKPAPPPASHFAVVRARVRRLSYFKPARSRAILAGADDGALPPPGVMQRDPSSEPSRNPPAGAPPSSSAMRFLSAATSACAAACSCSSVAWIDFIRCSNAVSTPLAAAALSRLLMRKEYGSAGAAFASSLTAAFSIGVTWCVWRYCMAATY